MRRKDAHREFAGMRCKRNLKHYEIHSWENPLDNPGVQKIFLSPQPTQHQHPQPLQCPLQSNCEIREKPQPLGARYTHTLPQLPTSSRRTCLKSPCSSPPRPTRAAGLKFPRRGRRAQVRQPRRPSAQQRLAAHLSPAPSPPQSPPAGEGVLGGAGAEGGAPRGRGPRPRSFSALSGTGSSSRWSELRGEQLLA